ncbi:class I tRNA ligase family protein [bacterium]|nr:class I tRNA ligase family protein [bacterium]
MIKVFDAKSNKKNVIVNKNVSMYVCGPTVYNDPHIGNIRPLLTFDVLYRLLKVQGYNVHYVHNITDIDDKIIQRAIQTNTDEMQIAKKYTEEYFKLMEAFNVFIPEIHKVSDEINEIIAFIQKLIDNKCAYVVNGDVYFDVKSIKNYGEVSHNNIQDLINNVRIENDNNKKNPLDFAL